MGDLLGSLVRGSQKQTILRRLGWVVKNGIRAIAQPEIRERAQAHEGRQQASVGTPIMG
jgi:hypothetical protein